MLIDSDARVPKAKGGSRLPLQGRDRLAAKNGPKDTIVHTKNGGNPPPKAPAFLYDKEQKQTLKKALQNLNACTQIDPNIDSQYVLRLRRARLLTLTVV